MGFTVFCDVFNWWGYIKLLLGREPQIGQLCYRGSDCSAVFGINIIVIGVSQLLYITLISMAPGCNQEQEAKEVRPLEEERIKSVLCWL